MPPLPPTPKPSASPSARSIERLLEAEELLAAKLMSRERASRARRARESVRGAGTRRGRTSAVRDATGLARCFIEWAHDYIRALEGKVVALRRSAEQDHLAVSKLVDDLLENSKKLLMLPLATLSALLHKVVRDLCRDQGKDAELVLRGDDVKIDKRILEELKDPLIHLLRNCIDHGDRDSATAS